MKKIGRRQDATRRAAVRQRSPRRRKIQIQRTSDTQRLGRRKTDIMKSYEIAWMLIKKDDLWWNKMKREDIWNTVEMLHFDIWLLYDLVSNWQLILVPLHNVQIDARRAQLHSHGFCVIHLSCNVAGGRRRAGFLLAVILRVSLGFSTLPHNETCRNAVGVLFLHFFLCLYAF